MTSAITPTEELTRRHPVPPGGFTFEPGERHVRGTIGAVTLVDSRAPVLVWDPIRAAEAIKDHLAVYNEVVDIVVDGVALARPESEFTAALSPGTARRRP
jgi:hypothetical protein